MKEQQSLLDVRGPDGQHFAVELAQGPVSIGRFAQYNDVALSPDPQQLVSRRVHCVVELEGGAWWVVDNGSVNGTFVQRGRAVSVVEGRTRLEDGDIVRILGRLTEGSEAVYWELTFRDPQKTRRVLTAPRTACLRYDWLQAKLFRTEGADEVEIRGLRPQEHKLVRYLAQRNRVSGDVPVVCTYDELLTAVWDEESDHGTDELNHIVWELRQKIESDPRDPQLLQTERGLGYRLHTCRAPRPHQQDLP